MAILFTLKTGQTICEHSASSSPFYVVVLVERGVFTGADNLEQIIEASTLLAFERKEPHMVRALEELVFIFFLYGAPGAPITPLALPNTDRVLP